MKFEPLGGRMASPSRPSCALGATRVLVLPIYPKKMLGGTPGTPERYFWRVSLREYFRSPLD